MFSKKVNEGTRRSIAAKTRIAKGEPILLEKLEFRRPGDTGISCAEYQGITCSKKASRDIDEGEFITWEMVE